GGPLAVVDGVVLFVRPEGGFQGLELGALNDVPGAGLGIPRLPVVRGGADAVVQRVVRGQLPAQGRFADAVTRVAVKALGAAPAGNDGEDARSRQECGGVARFEPD